jgi:hypothetical protein
LLQQILNVLGENMVRHAIEPMTYYLRRKRNTIPGTFFVEVSKVQSKYIDKNLMSMIPNKYICYENMPHDKFNGT